MSKIKIKVTIVVTMQDLLLEQHIEIQAVRLIHSIQQFKHPIIPRVDIVRSGIFNVMTKYSA